MLLVCGYLLLTATLRALGDAPPDQDNKSIRLLAWGDWGFDTADPKRVATAMSAYNVSRPADAAILLGDNFRVPEQDDAALHALFEGLYPMDKFNLPFYAVLGNHDYEGQKASVETGYFARHPGTRWHLPANKYRVDLPLSAKEPLVTLFMLDSNHDVLGQDAWNDQIAWITDQLSKPHGKWVVCCAHHTMFSNGGHGENGVLQQDWGTIFREKKVDFYLCGHDHSLQHLEIPDWPVSFVISGGGGAKRKEMLRVTAASHFRGRLLDLRRSNSRPRWRRCN